MQQFMSLEYAILGFLNHRPLSGYDLKKIFDTSVRHFWPADQSQIYRTLTRLTESGWTTLEVVEQTERPDRKVYHITGAGREELHRWLLAPIQPDEHRSAPLIQVFFAGQLTDDEVVHIFERAAEQMRIVLNVYENIPKNIETYKNYTASEREFYFWMLTLEAGMVTMRANLEWGESVITRIRTGQVPQE